MVFNMSVQTSIQAPKLPSQHNLNNAGYIWQDYLGKFRNENVRSAINGFLWNIFYHMSDVIISKQEFIAAKFYVEIKDYNNKRLLAIVNKHLDIGNGQKSMDCFFPVLMDDSLPDVLDVLPELDGLSFHAFIILKNKETIYGLFHMCYGQKKCENESKESHVSPCWNGPLKAQDVHIISKSYGKTYENKILTILEDNEFIEGYQPEKREKNGVT
jgi:hypothetical protein